jgi:hypothetical protein
LRKNKGYAALSIILVARWRELFKGQRLEPGGELSNCGKSGEKWNVFGLCSEEVK